MRTNNPLITISPAVPPSIGEIKGNAHEHRLVLQVVGALLVLVGLGVALMLS